MHYLFIRHVLVLSKVVWAPSLYKAAYRQSSNLQTVNEPKETIPPAYVAWRANTTTLCVVPARQAT
jgi:hypothetical protein